MSPNRLPKGAQKSSKSSKISPQRPPKIDLWKRPPKSSDFETLWPPKMPDFHCRGHQKQEIEGSRKSFKNYLKKPPFLEAFGLQNHQKPSPEGSLKIVKQTASPKLAKSAKKAPKRRWVNWSFGTFWHPFWALGPRLGPKGSQLWKINDMLLKKLRVP